MKLHFLHPSYHLDKTIMFIELTVISYILYLTYKIISPCIYSFIAVIKEEFIECLL